MHHDHCDGAGVELGPAGAAHHLKHVCDWKVHVSAGLAVVKLGTLDHDEVRRQVHPPRKSRRANEHLDLALEEELLAECSVLGGQARVMQPDAELKRMPQLG